MNTSNFRPRSLATALALLTLLGAIASGCSLPAVVAQQRTERRYYMVDPARQGEPDRANAKTTLKVRPFTVSPGFETHELIYKIGDQRFDSDYYNLLFMLPGPAMTQATRKWLDATGLFGHVVDSTSQAEETHALEGNLIGLYGDYTNPQTPKAVVEIQFFLLKENKANFTVIFQKSYRQETPLEGGSAENLANGLQKSLGAVLTALEGDLKGVTGK